MNPSHPPRHRGPVAVRIAAALIAVALPAAAPAVVAGPAEQLAAYAAEAGAPGDAARGQRFFTARHGREWTCASCHGTPPVQAGRHAASGKTIAPLAPAVNPERFTDAAKTAKWFRRNCNDVVGRECSAGEKADVLAYLASLSR